MAASTPLFTPATDTFGELTLRPAVPVIDARTRNAAIGIAFVGALFLGLAALISLDRVAYAQHDSDPYVAYVAPVIYQ